jgi:uncharacterized protein (TIGR02466 family)
MINNLFPIKIYKASYPYDLQPLIANLIPLIEFDKTLENNQGSMRGEGICSYVERRDLHELDIFAPVVKFIQTHVLTYWRELNYDPAYNPKIEEMWYNIYKEGSFIDLHNHAPRTLTCSFYLSKEFGTSNIVFENPLSTILKHQPYYIDKNNYHALFEEEVDAQSGDLIIFPGWLNHRTIKNSSTTDRIMIGANICIER